MRIFLQNNPAKFHPHPIRNNGAFGFFEQRCQNKNNMSGYMGPVPDPKTTVTSLKRLSQHIINN